ncbi:MAG TPA: cytochrome c oxidase assembly protein [Rhodocyclaceae bacterium]|nr:cytochrome c oxidase assembly protein [Rhodocyclaceae bacterium]
MPQESGGEQQVFSVTGRGFDASSGHRRLVGALVLAIIASVAFAFALVPLYDVLCRITGLNGRTTEGLFRVGGFNTAETYFSNRIDDGRLVTVQFTGTVMPGLPWEMRPLTASMQVHPGETYVVKYLVQNLSRSRMEGQAIPGVSPGQAARHFQKIECFCFAHQPMGPFEKREMTVAFVIRPDLDPEVSEVTLAYAFFPVPAARLTAFAPATTASSPAIRT